MKWRAPPLLRFNTNIQDRFSNAITHKKKMRLQEQQSPSKKSSKKLLARNWKSPRFAKAKSWVCTNSFSIQPMTGSICAMTRNPAADSPRGRCGAQSGCPAKRDVLISKMSGGKFDGHRFS